jgi:DNA-binding transcriptional LysR family regulator
MNLEGLSLDQMRAALAVRDAGSFTAAARQFRRAQSAVSYAVTTLEQQLGVLLFDRAGRRPTPTVAGRSLLVEMAAIVARADRLKAQAQALGEGLEPELALVVDAVWPMDRLAALMVDFQAAYPTVPVRVDVEAMGAVVERVLAGGRRLGVTSLLPNLPAGFERIALPPLLMVPVAAPTHPLAATRGAIPISALADQVQIVLTDRSSLTEGRDFGVFSGRTWRVADLGAKQALIRAGAGWGTLPAHMILRDVETGRLVRLHVEALGPEGDQVPMAAIHRADEPPGPATRWMIDRLKAETEACCPRLPA